MSAAGAGAGTLLVFDASALHHFALADRLDVLNSLVQGRAAVTTKAVRDELDRSAMQDARLRRLGTADWLTTQHVDDLDELVPLAKWVHRTGAGRFHRGEATVLAHAEVRDGIAVIDDRRAAQLGRRYGVQVHGTLWVIAEACRTGVTSVAAVRGLIDTLRATGARYPCDGPGFEAWARTNGLLDVERRTVGIIR